jgi:hypothetical protein
MSIGELQRYMRRRGGAGGRNATGDGVSGSPTSAAFRGLAKGPF